MRLGLERSTTAAEAAQVIIDLLEQFGQSGNCGYDKPFYYHNSYLIADWQSAWILETVGKQWALKKVDTIASISNQISIEDEFDQSSRDLIQHAIERHWCKSAEEFNFRQHYSDTLFTHFADGNRRSCETLHTLTEHSGEVTEETLFALLRHHRNGFPSSRSLTGANVCMHAGYGPVRGSQTTGSMVARITKDGITLWVTGSAAPCTGLFKPIWLESGLPNAAKVISTAEFNPEHLWWQHELLHRTLLKDPELYLPMIQIEQRQIEAAFLERARSIQHSSNKEEKSRISEFCFSEAAQTTRKWSERIQQSEPQHKTSLLYRRAWQKRNDRVKLPIKSIIQ